MLSLIPAHFLFLNALQEESVEGSMKFLNHLLLIFAFLILESKADSCICDTDSNRRVSARKLYHKKSVSFSTASISGEAYKRPRGASHYFGESNENLGKDDGLCQSEQIHISLGDSLDSITVSYTSPLINSSSIVSYSKSESDLMSYMYDSNSKSDTVMDATGSFRAYTELMYMVHFLTDPKMGAPTATVDEVLDRLDTTDWAYDHTTGEHYSNWYNVTSITYGFGQYNNPDMYYNSPMLHTVPITGLESDTVYYYRVFGSCMVYSFRTPPYYSGNTAPVASTYPYKIALTGDVGLTEVSILSIDALVELKPDVVLLAGDLCYSDGWAPTWDTWGRESEKLGANVPILTTGGNHEVQSGENMVPLTLRYTTPYAGAGSPDPSYWGREIGPVHVIALNTYSGYEWNSLQYGWLENYLATRVNRVRTPWLIVMMHTPWYNSNTGHWGEGERFRTTMEPLLHEYGVDIVLSGHVHSYERSTSVYNYTIDPCGTSYVNLGDGGNYEGYSGAWRDPQPDWSIFREASFGVASLEVLNSTHASFSWHRHACQSDDPATYNMDFEPNCQTAGDNSAQAMETSDSFLFVRPSSVDCPNHYMGTSFEPSMSSTGTDTDDDPLLSNTNIWILVGVCGLLCVVVASLVGHILMNRQRDGDQNMKEYKGYDYTAVTGGVATGSDLGSGDLQKSLLNGTQNDDFA